MAWHGQHILIAGLGLTGWSAVRYLHGRGARITVCDSRAEPPHAADLAREFPDVPLHPGLEPRWLDGADALLVSPGLALDQPLVRAARERGLPVFGDIEVFARDNRVPVLAVTGSNGKSTVVTLLAEMAREDGRKVLLGGNIGTPALNLLGQPADLIVLELSSFQLELTAVLDSVAAVVLNLSADHMDRHGSLAAYGEAKARIYRGAQQAVINRDDPAAAALADGHPQAVAYALDAPADFSLREGWLCRGRERWLASDELRLVGRHNRANVLAAFALGRAAGLSRAAMVAAAREFAGLPHRCQWVRERAGVTWINDSKGTNVGATLAALEGLEPHVVLLAGGQAKGGDFRPWRAPLTAKGRAVMLFGEDAEKIELDLDRCVPVRRLGELGGAIDAAAAVAQPGDSVLLSPGCASFDQFSGYAQRGECFIEHVRRLP